MGPLTSGGTLIVKSYRKAFTLVELLAVIMILAVLAAVAVPLYINSRASAAARTCLANIATIASNESAWATRHGSYQYDATLGAGKFVTQTAYDGTSSATIASSGLVGAPEGLASNVTCPLNKAGASNAYTVAESATGAGDCVITCTNEADHKLVITGGSWTTKLSPPAKESIP